MDRTLVFLSRFSLLLRCNESGMVSRLRGSGNGTTQEMRESREEEMV